MGFLLKYITCLNAFQRFTNKSVITGTYWNGKCNQKSMQVLRKKLLKWLWFQNNICIQIKKWKQLLSILNLTV